MIVYASDEPGTSIVAALDPVRHLAMTGKTSIKPLAEEVRSKIEKVLASLVS